MVVSESMELVIVFAMVIVCLAAIVAVQRWSDY
jgi:hypothetical protein